MLEVVAIWRKNAGKDPDTGSPDQLSFMTVALQVCFALCWTVRIASYDGPYTVKKVSGFPVPSAGRHSPNSPWPGKIKLFPARESLVSDIPPGDGKTQTFFLHCTAWQGLLSCELLAIPAAAVAAGGIV